MSDPKENEVKNELKLEVPNQLPEGFPPVEPHVNHESNKFTIYLKNGNLYTVTSNAKRPRDLLEKIICEDNSHNAIPRKIVLETEARCFFLFPEAVIQISCETLEGIEAGWPHEEILDEDLEDEDEDEEDEKPRKKPKKPW